MDYLILIFVAVAGIALGSYFARRKNSGLITEQGKKKIENKQKILDFLRENPNPSDGQVKRVTNNDVERLTGVSNATAERYLNELEKEGNLTQHGKIGQNVFYTLK